jgi:hypothetical protein
VPLRVQLLSYAKRSKNGPHMPRIVPVPPLLRPFGAWSRSAINYLRSWSMRAGGLTQRVR